jgi:hypothetical protein
MSTRIDCILCTVLVVVFLTLQVPIAHDHYYYNSTDIYLNNNMILFVFLFDNDSIQKKVLPAILRKMCVLNMPTRISSPHFLNLAYREGVVIEFNDLRFLLFRHNHLDVA